MITKIRDGAWEEVHKQATRLKHRHLRDLFKHNSQRFKQFSLTLDDLTIDFSREKLDAPALNSLLALAQACNVEEKRDAMFQGEWVNVTEQRPALHMALRGMAKTTNAQEVEDELTRFLDFAESIRNGAYQGAGGAFSDVVSIGVGGSDLGPAMAVQALDGNHNGPSLHFVSNLDGTHLADTLHPLDPKRTLVIVISKSFTTQETLVNAQSAKAWLANGISKPSEHMVFITANRPAVDEFIMVGGDRGDGGRIFHLWDWVGGRYSLWSAVGLPIAIAIGAKQFRQFLAGAAHMDKHFLEADLQHNLPIILALIGIWRRNAMGWNAVALIPYDQRLARFPAYIQQLDMESNGKDVDRHGNPIAHDTAPIIFGEAGTNAQHSFFQFLHQGSHIVPVDFIIAAQPNHDLLAHHDLLLASCFAQAQALAFGRSEAETQSPIQAHRGFAGDRPSTLIVHRRLDAFALGRLIALFEHKIFVQGAIWGINSFDQWGVELGKELTHRLLPVIKGNRVSELDSSIMDLIQHVERLRQ